MLVVWSFCGIVFYTVYTDSNHALNKRQFNFILFCGGPFVWLIRFTGKAINWVVKKLE